MNAQTEATIAEQNVSSTGAALSESSFRDKLALEVARDNGFDSVEEFYKVYRLKLLK